MTLPWALLLLAAVGVWGDGQSGNSQAAVDHKPATSQPAELVPVSAENVRFSRLLKESANVLQFSSISNDAPPLWGVSRDGKKKEGKALKKGSLTGPNFGRRSLDYDEQLQQGFEQTTSETRIVANAYPGNEYVFVRPGKAVVETSPDSDISASVTSINNKPARVPLALLRQKKGKRVNISPIFTEVPQVHQDSADATKEFVWVDQPAEQQNHRLFVAVNRQGRNHDSVDDATTNPAFQEEELTEATTPVDEQPLETTTFKQQNKSKLIVNVVTSAPRVSFDSHVEEPKPKVSRPRKTHSTTTTVGTTITTEATTYSTTHLPTTIAPPVLSSSSPKTVAADDKENFVTDAFHRSGATFQGFEDSQARLQTAETNDAPRVGVNPSKNKKDDYEYEYIYYYYDDEDDDGTKSKGKTTKAQAPGTQSTVSSSDSVASEAPVSPVAAVTTTTTTSTTTIAPELSSADADFEYEDEAGFEEEAAKVSAAPELQKNTPTVTRVVEEPIHKGISSAEKLSNSNPINQLDRSRSPKSSVSAKFDDSVADYKLETEASQEEEVVEKAHELSKGQPDHVQQLSSEENDELYESPAPVVAQTTVTAAPGVSSTSGVDEDHMSTLAKTHKDSVNVPIVLKQSNLLKAVPVSQLQSQNNYQLAHESPSTAPVTVPTTTAAIEAVSEVAPSVRPSPQRIRGGQRLRGSVSQRPTTAEPAAPVAEEKPQAVQRPQLRGGSRRIASRRPVQETTPEAAPVEQPVASPVIENQARPIPIRPRFPPRAGSNAVPAAPAAEVSDAPAVVSGAEVNSLDDKKAKDSQVRSKSANDLFAFARLQQAISSRAPSRIPPKLVGGFVNSAEATTDAITSSEVTTVSSLGGQSGETVVVAEPSTTTTTTTTEAPQEKPGRQRPGGGPRFGGRQRKPLGGASGATSTTTTEAPTTRGRFNGGRRRPTTAAPEASPSSSSSGNSNDEEPKPKIPSRNRFASRNRVSTTEASVTSEQKSDDSEKPSTSTPRRRPSGSFQGRRRPNQVQGQSDAATTPEETSSTSADASTASASTTAAPATPGRNRFNFAAAGGRQRPAAAAGNNPVRIRPGGRLRGHATSSTTEAAPVEPSADAVTPEAAADAEQSQSIQTENLEQSIQSTAAPEAVGPVRGSGGVLGRLKNRPKLVVTTTTIAPEQAGGDRKPSRLNGILNRRKNIGQVTAATVKEEVKEAEAAEEANNHAQEQDDDHKAFIVQVSSSVTESEETNAAHASEVVEQTSTTPGSILNRLKSQRRPGSLFRKKPDPHGE